MMTVADWIRSMTDEELAVFLNAILHERDVSMTKKLAEQGIANSLIEIPVASVAKHLAFLRSPKKDI